jgi:FdhD protein
VTEEPLELRLSEGSAASTLAITMRTPGNDFELAAGFLFDEAVVRSRDDIVGMTYCLDSTVDPSQRYNIVTVECRAGAAAADRARFERHFTIGSACGVCGRAQLDSLRDLGVRPIDDAVRVAASLLYQLPARMQEAQRVFASTGGRTRPLSSTSTATCSPSEKTSAATTPSTRSSAGACSTDACRLQDACWSSAAARATKSCKRA